MTPYYADDWLTVYAGDCRTVLSTLPVQSVHCVVTSPPYWGLRDYGTDGQLGLEASPEEYVANLVTVFREVRRVLRDDGTLWLNLGDSYSGGGGGYSPDAPSVKRRNEALALGDRRSGSFVVPNVDRRQNLKSPGNVLGLKPKDLVGIPWRVAFALQADGWYLRSDIIWAKPNPMPESVTDRPTKAHEYLFLLSKSPRYYFDQEAVRESYSEKTWFYDHVEPTKAAGTAGNNNGTGASTLGVRAANANAGRNIRSVWTIATRPYPGAHFAVFPPELPERCIKAGSSERGVCPECGAPWERVVERVVAPMTRGERSWSAGSATGQPQRDGRGPSGNGLNVQPTTTAGWQPTCRITCGNWHLNGEWHRTSPQPDPIPATILDPFAGSGTVGLVANRLSRRAILIDLNPAYLEQQMKRNAQTPLGLAL